MQILQRNDYHTNSYRTVNHCLILEKCIPTDNCKVVWKKNIDHFVMAKLTDQLWHSEHGNYHSSFIGIWFPSIQYLEELDILFSNTVYNIFLSFNKVHSNNICYAEMYIAQYFIVHYIYILHCKLTCHFVSVQCSLLLYKPKKCM